MTKPMKKDSNKPEINEFHVGQCIKGELSRQKRTITWLAKELDYPRDSLYKILRHSYINTNLLFRISYVLDHDFFLDCSENVVLKSRRKAKKAKSGGGQKKTRKSKT